LEIDVVERDPEIKNIKVLVVEDIVLNQLLMKTLLDDFEFEHDIAANGKIAIEKLRKKTYDIILMDLQMPEMNGFEATRFIRNQLKLQIPIIALTADVTTADLDKCKLVGMNDYISKPVDERILYNKIIDLFKKHSSVKVKENAGKTDIPEPKLHGRRKCVDLTYLYKRTKDHPDLMLEMIALYLEQTPVLTAQMGRGLLEKDWDLVYSSAHKMIPSFAIMGINKEFETMALKIQEYAASKKHLDEIGELISDIEAISSQACIELKEEYRIIEKNSKL
jgi:CheY-like chemotaxis protein